MNEIKITKSFLWRQRIGYGAADFACNLIWQMISLYLLYYYTDVANLDGLAMSASNLWLIVAWIALQNVGSTFAGEAMYKVWTQESFPVEVRSDLQGFINGFSRLLCAAFATITPVLVLPEHIRTTMFGFAGLILVAGLFGLVQIGLQKKHGVGSLSEKGE